MNLSLWLRNVGCLLVIALTMLTVTPNASAEWKEKVLYSFQDGSDGNTPAGGVVFDKAGNLYGATSYNSSCGNLLDCGAVLQLSLQRGVWIETTLHDFQGYAHHDGGAPQGGVILDASGNLYGTTAYGGTGGCVLLGTTVGCGTVYELSPPKQKGGQWKYVVLYNFQGGRDGLFPWGDLVFDKLGNLYGATQFGGGKGTTCNPYFDGNCGTVFQLSPPKQKGGAWKEKILYSFAGGADGATPNGGLVLDGKGAIYGTTVTGGYEKGICDPGGCGLTFELTPPAKGGPWTKKVLYQFHGRDGASPVGVIFGTNGNLYGSATGGGDSGSGVVFDLAAAVGDGTPWKETVLYRFNGGDDGTNPKAGLIFDTDGDLCGTTAIATNRSAQGNVFRLKPPSQKEEIWSFSVLHTFTGSPDGASPSANLVLNGDGGIVSTTQLGGTGSGCQGGCGTVFQLEPTNYK